MSNKTCIVVVILAVTVTSVLARPDGVALSIAKDKTICRTVVDYNESEDRIPRVIKELKCAKDPYEMCPASGGSDVPCCGGFPLANGASFTCTEVLDKVLVFDTKQEKYSDISVAVGCSCVKLDGDQAAES